MQLKDIKIKTIFNSNTKINYNSKNFANKTNLIIRQNISILLIEIIEIRTCFEKIIKNTEILIKKLIIYIYSFVVSRFNYKILLN